MDFGCSRKITYSEVIDYFDNDYSYILQDNGRFSNFIATTDLVYNSLSIQAEDFIQISFYHVNNDLLCSGVEAKYAMMNLCLPYHFDFATRKNIISFIRIFLKDNNIDLINAHTIVGESFFISWSLFSEKNEFYVEKDINNKNLFLSKPLGGSSSNLLSNLELMKLNNNFLLNYLNDICYMTDISGYGLYNELNSISKKFKLDIFLDKSKIQNIFNNNYDECKIKRNLDYKRDYLDNHDKEILFSNEFNGPVLFFSDLDSFAGCFKIGKVFNRKNKDWFNYE